MDDIKRIAHDVDWEDSFRPEEEVRQEKHDKRTAEMREKLVRRICDLYDLRCNCPHGKNEEGNPKNCEFHSHFYYVREELAGIGEDTIEALTELTGGT